MWGVGGRESGESLPRKGCLRHSWKGNIGFDRVKKNWKGVHTAWGL